MSYILEALKKAEQERNLGQIPPLTQPHTPLFSAAAETLPLQRATAWLMGSALLIAVGAGALGHWFAQQPNPSDPSAQPASTSVSPAVEGGLPAVVQKEEKTEKAEKIQEEKQNIIPPIVEVNPVITAVPKPSNPDTPLRPLTDMLAVTPPPKETQTSRPAITTTATAPIPAPPKPVSPPPVARVVKPTENPTPIPISSPIPETQALPLFQELPAQLQQRLSPLLIDVHVYAQAAQQRFVLINGQRYREGMTLKTDLTLLQIRPTDIVLRYQNQLFRLNPL